jgi:hypothetical protein
MIEDINRENEDLEVKKNYGDSGDEFEEE